MSRPRVIFDCNVLLQAILSPRGESGACLRLIEAGRVCVLVSSDTLREAREVLSRPFVRELVPEITPERVEAFLTRLAYRAEFVRGDSDTPVLDYSNPRSRAWAEDRLRTLSGWLFVGSLGGGVFTIGLLCAGLAEGGAGHGDWTIWYAGLLVWFFSWLALLASCIAGAVAWLRSRRPVWWILPGLALLLAAGAVGLWGLQGADGRRSILSAGLGHPCSSQEHHGQDARATGGGMLRHPR